MTRVFLSALFVVALPYTSVAGREGHREPQYGIRNQYDLANVSSVRNVAGFRGVDAGWKIRAAVDDLSDLGGVIDARALAGNQIWSTDPFARIAKPLTVLLGIGTTNVTADITIPRNVTLIVSQGAILSVATGMTMTIEGNIDGPISKRFAGLGRVSFSAIAPTRGIYPQWWGATGDGETDDTYALQSALNALGPDEGRYVFIPCGIYKVTTTLNVTYLNGPHIEGASSRCTILRPSTTLVGKSVVKFGDVREAYLEHLRIEGNSAAPPTAGIEFSNVAGSAITPTNNRVKDVLLGSSSAQSLMYGIRWTVDGGTDENNDVSVVEDCYFANFAVAALSIEHSNSLNHRFMNLTIFSETKTSSGVLTRGGSFTMIGGQISIGESGWDFDIQAPLNGRYFYPQYIIGTSSESRGGILQTASTDNIWVSLQAYHRQGATLGSTPIDFQSRNGRLFIGGGSIFNLGQRNTWSMTGADSYVSIVNTSLNPTTISWENQLVLDASFSQSARITLKPGPSARLIEGAVTGNHVGDYLDFQATAPTQQLPPVSSLGLNLSNLAALGQQDTQGADLVSASDLLLGVEGTFFTVTGTTSISTILSPRTGGSIVTLQFADTVTVGHNKAGKGAGIYLSGGRDFKATQFDTLTLRFNSSLGKWVEISRTVI